MDQWARKLIFKIHYADFFLGIAQNRLVHASGCCDASCGAIGCLLKYMSCVSAQPFPADFVRRRGLIESIPPRQISLASKPAVHRFNNISRVSEQAYLTRKFQRFESNRRSGNLSLLIRGHTQILAKSAPVTFMP